MTLNFFENFDVKNLKDKKNSKISKKVKVIPKILSD
jgi:hypothetical protein